MNNLVVIRFLPWSDRLGYFLYIYGRILTRNAETSMTNNYQIYVCVFFSRNSFVGYKKISYICSVNSKLKPWRRTREFTLFIMYRIFISHSWSYSSDYDKIESFLRQEGIAFYNHSVPKNDPIHTNGTDKQLSDAIEAKVKGCSCVIILAGVYATYSKWINKEIEMAKKYSKPIIAVQPWGAEHTSNVVKNAADVIVGWNAKSVANAVRNYAINQSL